MKPLRLLFASVIAFSFFSCSEDEAPSSPLIGTWKAEFIMIPLTIGLSNRTLLKTTVSSIYSGRSGKLRRAQTWGISYYPLLGTSWMAAFLSITTPML